MTQEFIKKVAELQSEVKVLKSLKNDFGKYSYRNVEQILAEVKPILKKLDLTIFMSDEIVCLADSRFYIKATVTLTDGVNKIESFGFAREAEMKRGMDEAQLTGSCSSYARKYALCGLLLLDDNKDIDSMDNTTQTNEKNKTSSNSKTDVDVKTNVNIDLKMKKLKESIFAKLLEAGIKKDEILYFFDYVNVNKDSDKDLQDLLNFDIKELVDKFKKEKKK